MTTNTNQTVLLSTLSLSLCLCLSCKDEEDLASGGDTISLGVFIDASSDDAGAATISSTILVLQEINAAGGLTIDGVDYTLDYHAEDHQQSGAGGYAAVEAMAAAGVTTAIGPPWSSITLGSSDADYTDGAAQSAVDNRVLLMADTATSPLISDIDDDDLVWRTCPSDALQAVIGAQTVYNDYSKRKAAILFRDDAWGGGLEGAFTEEFEALGGEVVAAVSFDSTGETIEDLSTYEFNDELAEIFAAQPDIIYLPTFAGSTYQISNRIVAGGYLDAYGDNKPLFFGVDGNYGEDLLVNAAPDMLENMAGTVPTADIDSADFIAFAEAYSDAGLGEPSGFSANRYDGTYLVAYAMQAAQSTDPDVYKSYLRDISQADDGDTTIHVASWAEGKAALEEGKSIDYEGAGGPISFTEQGDPGAGRYIIWKVVSSGNGFEMDEDTIVTYEAE